MLKRRNRKAGLVPCILLSGLLTCIPGQAQVGPKAPQYIVISIMDYEVYDYYCREAATDAGLTALLEKTNFLGDTGFLYALYRAAAAEYLSNLRSFHFNVDSNFGDVEAINNHSEILFRSGTVYKWTGKGVDYVRRTPGPPFPGTSGRARGSRQPYLAPDAHGMNDAGVVVGASWAGLYSCGPGGSSALLAGEASNADAANDADDTISAAEVAEALRAMKSQIHGSPVNGRGPSGRAANRRNSGGQVTGSSLKNPGLDAYEERHRLIADAANRLLPQGPSRVIVHSASESYLIQHPDMATACTLLDDSANTVGRINNKGHMIAQTAVQTDGSGWEVTPILFGQNGQFTTLESVLSSLVKTKDDSPLSVNKDTGKVEASLMPGAQVPIVWGTSLSNADYAFRVQDLNDQDHLAGTLTRQERLVDFLAQSAAKPGAHADLMSANAALWKGKMVALRGPVNSVSTQACALNNLDQVVGNCLVHIGKDEDQRVAALWRDGKVYDLNTCIAPGSGWSLTNAQAINDKGEIVGRGVYQGRKYSFLLMPASEVAPVAGLKAPVPR